jgi:ketosteroid isomerase-like protein
MENENVKIVRQAYEANRSGPPAETVDRALVLAHPDCEFISRLTSVEGATYRGHEGVRAYFEDLADAFREWRNEVDQITEVGPQVVMTEGICRATGKSGVEVELRTAMVWELSDGKVIALHAYPTRQEALEAAGLAG